MSNSPRSEIYSICDQWSDQLMNIQHENRRIDFIRSVLPQLLRKRQLWLDLLQGIVKGSSYPDLRQATMFRDELVLYPNAKRLFSLRLFIYPSRIFTPIHDHNAWGVIGAVLGPLEVVRYRRVDDGRRDGYADLLLDSRQQLDYGEVEVTQTLDAGIHQTGNPGDGTSIMLSVYGNPIRRLHINRFEFDSKRVIKMYPPRMQKKKLADGALDAFKSSKA